MCAGNCNGTTLPVGPAGADGLNAFTTLTASFVQPAVGSNVTISVLASGQSTGVWAGVGQPIFIVGGGTYEVISVNGTNSLTVKNLYAANTAAAATIANGGKVSPAGLSGSSGSSGAAGSNGTNGTNGVSLLFYDLVHADRTANTYGVVKTYAIAGNTLSTNGDVLRVEAVVIGEPDLVGSAPLTTFKVKIELDGQVVCGEVLSLMNAKGADQNGAKLCFDIKRLSATTFDSRADQQAYAYGYALPSFGSSTAHILGTPVWNADIGPYSTQTVAGFGSAMNLTISTSSQNSQHITVCAVKVTTFKV